MKDRQQMSLADWSAKMTVKIASVEAELADRDDYGSSTGFLDELEAIIADAEMVLRSISRRCAALERRARKYREETTVQAALEGSG